jgi:putative FmdB family regulatory protein
LITSTSRSASFITAFRTRRWRDYTAEAMPIYEYVCMECESHFEELVAMSEPDPSCPDCDASKVRKQFSVFATHGTAAQPSFGQTAAGGGGCCGGSCGCG